MHNYVCSKERTVVRRAVLTQTEVRAPSTSAPQSAAGAGLLTQGCLVSVDWTTGLEYWNGLKCFRKAFQKVVTHSVTSLTCSMPCLGVLPRSLGGQSSLHIKLPLNNDAGVRLSLVLFKPSTFSKHVEMYLQSLVTTIVFLGLACRHSNQLELPENGQRQPASLIQLGTGTCSQY